MNKKIGILCLMLGLMMAIPVAFAVPDVSKPAVWKHFPDHIYLYEKDCDWEIVDGGAWGRINKGVFNGHGLEPLTEYALINYIDPWGSQNVILGSRLSSPGGNVNIKVDLTGISGKVWLVLADDIDANGYMTGWHPTEYLFEYNLLP